MKKILVVDDEPDIAAIIGNALARYDYSFDLFTDSLSALHAFISSPSSYSLLITDVRMPGMNGFELAEKVRQIRGDIEVLLMTAYLAEEITKTPSYSIFKKDVIEKPFQIEKFCREVRRRLQAHV